MIEFWTVTNEHTNTTNSSSTRYPTEEKAISEARRRLSKDAALAGVFILKATRYVRRETSPIIIEETTPFVDALDES